MMIVTNNRIILSWKYILQSLKQLDIDHPGHKIYGVPKGGMIACAFLSRASAVTHPADADVILDDIVDSGRTQKWFKDRYPSIPFVTLYDKNRHSEEDRNKWVEFPWETDHPTGDSGHDNVLRILQCIGEDPYRPGLAGTPDRVVRSWHELFLGYKLDPDEILTLFDEGEGYDEIILLRDVEMYSCCEHHMLPFFGKAHIAYLPGSKLLGVSKLARLLEVYSRRLQIQERIGRQVTNFLMNKEKVGAAGAACIIEASHLCMQMRGVEKQNSVMVTSSLEGVFLDDPSARSELFGLIRG